MERLVIAGRVNTESGAYIRLKVTNTAMRVLQRITKDMGDDFTYDDFTFPKSLSALEPWKDKYILVNSEHFDVEIVIGERIIHVFVRRMPNVAALNTIIDKHCVWATPMHIKKK